MAGPVQQQQLAPPTARPFGPPAAAAMEPEAFEPRGSAVAESRAQLPGSDVKVRQFRYRAQHNEVAVPARVRQCAGASLRGGDQPMLDEYLNRLRCAGEFECRRPALTLRVSDVNARPPEPRFATFPAGNSVTKISSVSRVGSNLSQPAETMRGTWRRARRSRNSPSRCACLFHGVPALPQRDPELAGTVAAPGDDLAVVAGDSTTQETASAWPERDLRA
jgi:hypothetical protein